MSNDDIRKNIDAVSELIRETRAKIYHKKALTISRKNWEDSLQLSVIKGLNPKLKEKFESRFKGMVAANKQNLRKRKIQTPKRKTPAVRTPMKAPASPVLDKPGTPLLDKSHPEEEKSEAEKLFSETFSLFAPKLNDAFDPVNLELPEPGAASEFSDGASDGYPSDPDEPPRKRQKIDRGSSRDSIRSFSSSQMSDKGHQVLQKLKVAESNSQF